MLFRQLFERDSSTYTYLLAARRGGEALLIDPVKGEVGKYLQLINELDLRLVFAIDTHVHADHVTGLGELHNATSCATIMGAQSKAECVSRKVRDGELLEVDGLELRAALDCQAEARLRHVRDRRGHRRGVLGHHRRRTLQRARWLSR